MSTLGEVLEDAKRESRGIAWPTIILAGAILITFTGSISAGILGLAPLWLLGLINTYCMFCCYTPVHEGIHRNIHGGVRDLAWLNNAIAYVLSVPLFISFTMQKYVHLQHHAHVNDPRFDNDVWIHSKHAWRVFLKSALYLLHQNYHAIKTRIGKPRFAEFLFRSIIEQAVPWTIAVLLILNGQGTIFLYVWLLPTIVGVIFILVSANWIVHREPDGGSQFNHTRILGAPKGLLGDLMTWAYVGGNYHLIHHLYPRIPFYKHRSFFDRHETALRNAGAKVYPFFYRA